MRTERTGVGTSHQKRRATLWLLLVLAVAGLTALTWPGPGWLRTDVRALLPEAGDHDGQVSSAARELARPYEQATLWLVGAPDARRAAAAARTLAARLRDSGVFTLVEATVERDRYRRAARALAEYRYALLTPDDAARLCQNPDEFLQRRLASQYSLAGATGTALARDPLGLYQRYLRQALGEPTDAAGRIVDDVPVVQGPNRRFGLVTAQARPEAFGVRSNPRLLHVWRDGIDWAESQSLRLHATGAPLYSAFAAASARAEVGLIGGLSLAAIALLLIGRFRSPRPFLVTLVVVASGVGGGFAGTLLLFDQMHLITLVFGATVIGISVDYAFHYLSDSLRPNWTPEDGLRHVGPTLRLALVTSMLAFLSLALAPFPALRQVAVFTASGLLAGWATVVLLLPLLVRPSPRAPAPRRHAWNLPVRPRRVVIAVVLLAVPGLLMLHPTDDVRLLYAAPDRLSADDTAIGELLPHSDGNRFLLIRAGDREALLEREEALRSELDSLLQAGDLDAYRAITDLLPSKARQRANEQVLRELTGSGRYQRYLRQLGFDREFIAQRIQAIREPGPWLDAEAALAVAGKRLRSMWFGCDRQGCRSAIVVTGAGDGRALAGVAADHEGVLWVNRVAAVNETMRAHRRLSLALLLGAMALVTGVLAVALGVRRAVGVVTVPAVALLVSLAVVGYSGALFSVFNLMALLLVLGVGIDYALFYHCAPPEGQPTAALGIGMAALTTVLAFGLLVFSATPVIRAFGMTLLPGLLSAYGLALITGRRGSVQQERRSHESGL